MMENTKKKKILIILLIISVLLNLLFLVLWAPTPYNSYDIKGAYSMGIEHSDKENNIYLGLYEDGKFMIQTPYYTLARGRYEKLNQNNDLSKFNLKTKLNIYKLVTTDKNDIFAYIIFEDKNIVFLDFNTNENFLLKKTNSVPVVFNVEDK